MNLNQTLNRKSLRLEFKSHFEQKNQFLFRKSPRHAFKSNSCSFYPENHPGMNLNQTLNRKSPGHEFKSNSCIFFFQKIAL
jgi:hypothetical protein